jgi:hypothetical protein
MAGFQEGVSSQQIGERLDGERLVHQARQLIY